MEGLVEGKRCRGRPKQRWLDNVFKWTSLKLSDLNNISRDRVQWRKITHVDAQSATSGVSDFCLASRGVKRSKSAQKSGFQEIS